MMGSSGPFRNKESKATCDLSYWSNHIYKALNKGIGISSCSRHGLCPNHSIVNPTTSTSVKSKDSANRKLCIRKALVGIPPIASASRPEVEKDSQVEPSFPPPVVPQ